MAVQKTFENPFGADPADPNWNSPFGVKNPGVGTPYPGVGSTIPNSGYNTLPAIVQALLSGQSGGGVGGPSGGPSGLSPNQQAELALFGFPPSLELMGGGGGGTGGGYAPPPSGPFYGDPLTTQGPDVFPAQAPPPIDYYGAGGGGGSGGPSG